MADALETMQQFYGSSDLRLNDLGDGSKGIAQGGYQFNGTVWEPKENGIAVANLFPLAARTATITSPTIVNKGNRGIYIWIHVTVGGTVLQPLVYTINPATGTAQLGHAAAATSAATGDFQMCIYPGILQAAQPTTAMGWFNSILPRSFQIAMFHTDATPSTYSLSYQLLP